MLPVQYASTINIGVLDGQFLILLLMLKHSGMANTNIKLDVSAVSVCKYVFSFLMWPQG